MPYKDENLFALIDLKVNYGDAGLYLLNYNKKNIFFLIGEVHSFRVTKL